VLQNKYNFEKCLITCTKRRSKQIRKASTFSWEL